MFSQENLVHNSFCKRKLQLELPGKLFNCCRMAPFKVTMMEIFQFQWIAENGLVTAQLVLDGPCLGLCGRNSIPDQVHGVPTVKLKAAAHISANSSRWRVSRRVVLSHWCHIICNIHQQYHARGADSQQTLNHCADGCCISCQMIYWYYYEREGFGHSVASPSLMVSILPQHVHDRMDLRYSLRLINSALWV